MSVEYDGDQSDSGHGAITQDFIAYLSRVPVSHGFSPRRLDLRAYHRSSVLDIVELHKKGQFLQSTLAFLNGLRVLRVAP
jgi:hypothetical protein